MADLICPHCGKECEINLVDFDYRTDFRWYCEHCDGEADVHCEAVPVFHIDKVIEKKDD